MHTPGFATYADGVIAGLDYTATGLGVGKTITALSQTDGVISATASDIAITAHQVSANGSLDEIAIATGDGLPVFDAKYTKTIVAIKQPKKLATNVAKGKYA